MCHVIDDRNHVVISHAGEFAFQPHEATGEVITADWFITIVTRSMQWFAFEVLEVGVAEAKAWWLGGHSTTDKIQDQTTQKNNRNTD